MAVAEGAGNNGDNGGGGSNGGGEQGGLMAGPPELTTAEVMGGIAATEVSSRVTQWEGHMSWQRRGGQVTWQPQRGAVVQHNKGRAT
ncbi:hypothetical protein CVT25_015706 [Psilocybe cyanescens]|uniref:Uncharacterized protein n=1 Tax=Psilocybe cyanescens TaxID=93625 RepID=A0A409XSY7_PSICY|nr:hypothetical protein CVT25_015706 [Psilocybe cyanescens]